jgi:K+-sensing histidine kinase KdpD
VLAVHDEDSGVSPDPATHVFDRFPSADPHGTDNRGGTGLGLAITAAILEAHHSRIKLQKGGLRAASQRHPNSVVAPRAILFRRVTKDR